MAIKAEMIYSHNNSIREKIGDTAQTFTLDTGAEIKIVLKEVVPKELMTGKHIPIKNVNGGVRNDIQPGYG